MAGSYLLDTNVAIAFFSNEAAVVERVVNALDVFLSTTVLGELYFGAFRSAQASTNLTNVDQYGSRIAVLTCDPDVARVYVPSERRATACRSTDSRK